MKLLNLCCGATRPASTPSVEWVNVDNLHATLLPGTPERENLDREVNYLDCNVTGKAFDGSKLIPAEWAETFDGILASHCFEHWDCQDAAYVARQCNVLLKPGGILLVSVPDAEMFRILYEQDDGTNAEELFGEPIFAGDGEKTFTNYCLWNRYHKAILDETALWHYFRRAGFNEVERLQFDHGRMVYPAVVSASPLDEMVPVLNRLAFSLVMMGVKE